METVLVVKSDDNNQSPFPKARIVQHFAARTVLGSACIYLHYLELTPSHAPVSCTGVQKPRARLPSLGRPYRV